MKKIFSLRLPFLIVPFSIGLGACGASSEITMPTGGESSASDVQKKSSVPFDFKAWCIESSKANAAADQLDILQVLEAQSHRVHDPISRDYHATIRDSKIECDSLTEWSMKVESLSLSHSKVADFSPVSALIQLKYLNLEAIDFRQNGGVDFYGAKTLRDITFLSPLIHLEKLTLAFNQIQDLAPLAPLSQLRELRLDMVEDGFSDLSPLKNLSSLVTLEVCCNSKIKDITPLASLTGLKNLYIDSTGVTDLRPIAHLENLASVFVTAENFLAGDVENCPVDAKSPGVKQACLQVEALRKAKAKK